MKKILRTGLAFAAFSTVFIIEVVRAGDLRLPETKQCSVAFQAQKTITHRLSIEMIKSLVFENPRALRDLLPTLEEDLIQALQLQRRSLLEKVGVVQSKDPQTRFYELTTQQIESQLNQLRANYQKRDTFTYNREDSTEKQLYKLIIMRVYDLFDTLPSLIESINHAWKISQSIEEREFYFIYIFKLYEREGARGFYEAAVKVDFASLWADYNKKFDEAGMKKALDATNEAYHLAEAAPNDVIIQSENKRLHKIYNELYGNDRKKQWHITDLLKEAFRDGGELLNVFSYSKSQNDSVNELEKYLASSQRSDFRAKEVGEKYIKDYIFDSVANQTNLKLMVLKAERILRTQGDVSFLKQVVKLLQGHINRHAKAQRFITDNARAYENTHKAIEYYSDVQSYFSRLNDLIIQSQEIKYKLSYAQLVKAPNTFVYNDEPLTLAEVNELTDGWDVLPRVGTLSSEELKNPTIEFKKGTTWDDVHLVTSLIVDSFGNVQSEIISLNGDILLRQKDIKNFHEKLNSLKHDVSNKELKEILEEYQKTEEYLILKVRSYDAKVAYLSQLNLTMKVYLEEAEKFISLKLGNQQIVSLLADGIQAMTLQAVAMTEAVQSIKDQQMTIQDQRAKLILLKAQLLKKVQNRLGNGQP